MIDWLSDTIKARLVASSAVFDEDTDVMTGITGIGSDQTLSDKTQTKDDTTDRIVFSNTADVTWASVALGSTVGWLCLYQFVTGDADSVPIIFYDMGNLPTNGSSIVLRADAAGLFYTQQ